jgi:hypothetical protein
VRKIFLILLMIGAFFTLLAMAGFGWSERKPKGYTMKDGRKNPFESGSAEAANWAKNNPVVPMVLEEKEIEKLIEPIIDDKEESHS